jgi:glutamate--cysteine ligase
VRRLARDLAVIARDGLRSRKNLDANGADECSYLDPIQAIAAGAPTQAEHWMGKYQGEWAGDASRILAEAAV